MYPDQQWNGSAAERGVERFESSHDGRARPQTNDLKDVSEDLGVQLKTAATTTARAVSSQAADLVSNIGSELAATAEDQKGYGADLVQGFASAIHTAADELQEQSPAAARNIHTAADSMDSLAETLRKRKVEDLVAAAADTARSHPSVFFLSAVAAGFAVSRFVKSTAKRGDGRDGLSASTQVTGGGA